MKLSFYISSQQLNAFLKVPGQIKPGDRMSAVSQKYADENMTSFVGDTYANYYVLASTQVSQNVWKVRTSSVRYLNFAQRGYLIVMGVSDQLWTLNDEGRQLINLEVLEDNLSVISGTGEFAKTTIGTYNVQTVGDRFHQGTLVLTSNHDNQVVMMMLFIVVVVMILLRFLRRI